MCKENQRVLPFQSREACDVSFFAFPCNRNLRLHNIHDKKKKKEKEHCCPATGKHIKNTITETKKSVTLAQQGPIKAKCKIARSNNRRDE
jgi:hypothetical protein